MTFTLDAFARPGDDHSGAFGVGPLVDMTPLVTGSDSNGDIGIFRWDMAPHAGGAAPHYHHTFSETFYVLAGQVRLFDGQNWIDGHEGHLLHVPRSAVHGFANESDEPASMLIIFAPGAPREEYFRELAAIVSRGVKLTDDERAAFQARHDQYPYLPDQPST